MTTHFQYHISKNMKPIAHSIKLLFLFCLSFLYFHSCTAPIEIDTDDSDPVIVIYGTITDELKNQEVRISRSSPYFQDKPNAGVSGAIVTIESSDNKKYELFEIDTVPGLYRSLSAWALAPGITYNLKVQVDFNEDGEDDIYTASTTVPTKVYTDSIKLVPMNIMGHKNLALNIYAQDSPEHDYYLFKYIVNDTLVTPKISQYRTYDDLGINGQYLTGLTIDYLDDIENWKNDTEDQRKRSIYLKVGDVLVLETSSIPKGYHDFINQCQKEMNGENPIFGGPASNIITNISNGGVGFFCGYCISQSTTTVTDL